MIQNIIKTQSRYKKRKYTKQYGIRHKKEKKTRGSRWSYIVHLGLLARTEELPEIPTGTSDLARDFILQCLNRDYNSRPSVDQLLTHPFVN